MVAAAADHWFATPTRTAVCRALTAGRPIRRDGGGWDDLAAMAAYLRAGRTVVVFPEGTRSRDGALAGFRSGAFRLAALGGVPVVPAAVVGAADVLPIDGGGRPRRAPCEVRYGTPVDPGLPSDDPEVGRQRVRAAGEAAHAQVVALLGAGPARRGHGPTHRRVACVASGGTGAALAFGWGAAEGVSWPLMAELFLMGLVPAAPSSAARLVPALAAGSVVGVLTTAALARRGVVLPAPLTTPRMGREAAARLAADGGRAMFSQLTNGVPVKVYAREAGRAGLPAAELAVWTAAARGTRVTVLGAGLAAAGTVAQPVLRTTYGGYLVGLGGVFGLLLRRIVRSWR